MRRALLSVAVGLAGAAVLTGAAWSLETVGLPPPARADRVAAAAAGWLDRYRLTIDAFRVGGKGLTGLCLDGTAPGRRGHAEQGVLLAFVPGPVVFVSERYGSRLVAGRRIRGLRATLAARVGCTRDLLAQLGRAAALNLPLRAERAYAAGQPAIALHVPPLEHERLTLYVSPRTYRPLVAIARVGRQKATARLFLTRATRGLLARFRLGPAGTSETQP